MKNLIRLVFLFFLLSCSASKKASKLSNNGNHFTAINVLTKKIAGGVSQKQKSNYFLLLQTTYNKLVSQSSERINYLKKDASSNKFEEIYTLYLELTSAQKSIKPLLPYQINQSPLNFNMQDYSSNLVASKNELVAFLYQNAKNNLASDNKNIVRQTFDDLVYLNQLQPSFKDVAELTDQAKLKGTDFVFISLENQTQIAIPKRLEEELLQFSSFGLNDAWTIYHSKKRLDIVYDYQIRFSFQSIMISPERAENNKLIKEKIITDGTEFLVNEKGEQIRDNQGNLIKIDKKVTISCEINELIQMKDAKISAKVEFWDKQSSQLIKDFPLQSDFSFRDVSAYINGDKRALDEAYFLNIKNPLPFPSNEQIIYEGGQNLKNQLKNILITYKN